MSVTPTENSSIPNPRPDAVKPKFFTQASSCPKTEQIGTVVRRRDGCLGESQSHLFSSLSARGTMYSNRSKFMRPTSLLADTAAKAGPAGFPSKQVSPFHSTRPKIARRDEESCKQTNGSSTKSLATHKEVSHGKEVYLKSRSNSATESWISTVRRPAPLTFSRQSIQSSKTSVPSTPLQGSLSLLTHRRMLKSPLTLPQEPRSRPSFVRCAFTPRTVPQTGVAVDDALSVDGRTSGAQKRPTISIVASKNKVTPNAEKGGAADVAESAPSALLQLNLQPAVLPKESSSQPPVSNASLSTSEGMTPPTEPSCRMNCRMETVPYIDDGVS